MGPFVARAKHRRSPLYELMAAFRQTLCQSSLPQTVHYPMVYGVGLAKPTTEGTNRDRPDRDMLALEIVRLVKLSLKVLKQQGLHHPDSHAPKR